MNFFFSLLHITDNITVTIILIAAYAVSSVGAAIHILLYKQDLKTSVGWIALVFLSPFIGVLLYVFLGINRVKRKANKLRKKRAVLGRITLETKQELLKDLPANYKEFLKFERNVYDQAFTYGNNITPLLNGTQAYPEMIQAVRKAKKEVIIESYIFDVDSETDKFLRAFRVAIKNGAAVKVLVDGFGTLRFLRRSIEKKLKSIKGLEYSVFLPPLIPVSFPFVHLRNHRKLMVIDGHTAFFGGMNLSKDNVEINNLKTGVLDLTFKVEGPVVDQITQVFEDDWEYTTGKKMLGCSKFARLKEKGKLFARVVPDGPDENNGRIETLVHARINLAQKHILIVTPYFLPENNLLTALELASMRGVKVEIILPELNNHMVMRWAEEPNFARLIKKGIRIYRTPRPFDHSKLFVIDSEWSFIGSANWDVRSFKLLFEANMEVIGKKFAAQLIKIADKKKKPAKRATLSESTNLPILKRLRNNLMRLMTPYY